MILISPSLVTDRKAGRNNAVAVVLKAVLPQLAAFALAYLLWKYAAHRIGPMFFPSPERVFYAALELVQNGELLRDIAFSFGRILAGFLIGSSVAIPLGLLLGTNPLLQRMLGPFIGLLRFIPPITMIIFAIVWFGAGETSKIFLVAFGTVFTVAINVEAGVRFIPRNQLRAAASLGASRFQTFRSVYLPSSVPFILTGMRIAMGTAFAVITAAELISADAGLGYLLEISRSFMQTDRLFVSVVTLGLLGLLTDRAFRLMIWHFGGEYVR
jgi:NitT/TauT family transport system permease protein